MAISSCTGFYIICHQRWLQNPVCFISTPPLRHVRRFTTVSAALKEADVVSDNRVEEIISPPNIVNTLTVSVQTYGKKKLILVQLGHINLHVYIQKFNCENFFNLYTIKNTFAKGYIVFSFDLKSEYVMDIFQDHRQYLAFSLEFSSGHTRFFHLLFAFWAFRCLSLWKHIRGTGNSNCHIFRRRGWLWSIVASS